jgi:hypothetical protein
MGIVYYIDFENVHFNGLKGIEELEKEDSVLIYCRKPDIARIKQYLPTTKAKVKCCLVEGVSKNALDFELISDLFMAKRSGLKIIISNDKGFDAAIIRGMKNNILCFRKKTIRGTKFETFMEAYGETCKEVVLQ